MENKLVKLIIGNLSQLSVVETETGIGYKIPTESGQIFIHRSDLDSDLVKVYLDQDGQGKLDWTLNLKNSKIVKQTILEKMVTNNHQQLEEFLKREKEVKQDKLNREFIQFLEAKITTLPNGKGSVYQTTRQDFKKKLGSSLGFSSNDLLESRSAAYHHFLAKYGKSFQVKPIQVNNFEIEWVLV